MLFRSPETEHRPGLERLLETTHLELDGKLFVNTQQTLPGAPTVGVSTPGVPRPTSKLLLRVPAQMGQRKTEHKGENSKGKLRPRVVLRPGRMRLQ